MTRIYRESDADPSSLELRPIAVIGYGNQGRAQALNLRDSGATVIIGNIDDAYRQRALEDGFSVLPIADAVQYANVVMLLVSDEIAPRVFERSIRPNLKRGDTVCFASGYNVAFGNIVCPPDVDVVLLAPRMIGTGVRERYLSREGFYSFVAVEQDASGKARDILLALAWGIGTLCKGALEVTFRIETELDLFNEQAFGPAFGRVLLTAINTLIDAGYPKEAVLLEFYLSGEFGYICKAMSETGLVKQLDHHSQTSQYGAISRGIKFIGINLAKPMKRILADIRSGKFAREWSWEQWTGKLRYRFLRSMALRQPINGLEQSVRKELGLTV
jgi:ketol-acid reductoisomerase